MPARVGNVGPAVFRLTPEEAAQAARAADLLLAECSDTAAAEFPVLAAVHAYGLPPRLRGFLLRMRAQEHDATFAVEGFPVDDAAIGPTPARWGQQPDPSTTLALEACLALSGSVLGDLFGWATQQDGALIHDIAPNPDDADSQVGSSSAELLWWHTEEAFHPLRCDYLGLLCLRNHDRVPTTVGSVGDVELDTSMREVLFEPRYRIRPDDSHLADRRTLSRPEGKKGRLLAAARQRIDRMDREPQRVALLSGDPDAPYLAVDPYYTDIPADDPDAVHAFDSLRAQLDKALVEVVLEPGSILFIDNFRAVHGRAPFHARYDGTDRWLKRVNITRDVRKSRAHRLSSDSWTVY
jgi:enduracididine beta-hydroxylase